MEGANLEEKNKNITSTSNDTIFVVARSNRSVSNTQIEVTAQDSNFPEIRNDDISNETRNDVIMAVYYRNGKFGAAYYNFMTLELHMLDEIVDRRPTHQMLCNLYRQVEPTYLITDQKLTNSFLDCLKRLVSRVGSRLDSSSEYCPLKFVSPKEYNFESCKRRVYALTLPNEPKNASEDERKTFIRSIVDFSYTQSIHALGMLLKYLDKNWSCLNMDIQGKPDFMWLHKISLGDIVSMDDSTYKGLQIFNQLPHPSDYKKGSAGSAKEGLSIYSMHDKCCSKPGTELLRIILQHPTQDIGELNRRYDVIAFCNKPGNEEIVHSICCSLRYIKNVNGILAKIKSLTATPAEWKSLYNTIYNSMLICEICENSPGVSTLIDELGSLDNKNLYQVAFYMNKIIDFDLSKRQGKFTVKVGVDPELDQKKQTMSSLHGLMSSTAKEELTRLPPCVQECTMVYIPHLGYMLGVRVWDEHLTKEDKALPGLKFMFQNHDYIHYKSKGSEELDMMIGDTYPEILAHETRIMMRLQEEVLLHFQPLCRVINMCAQLDCLIALSKVCKTNNYIRPVLKMEKIINIVGGRHPLQELCVNNFVPNDTKSSESSGLMTILTGPNSSGKSVYLKQVALIVYLAHIGSFVPADYAEIGVVDQIHTRIHSVESIAVQMSGFLMDLRQMSVALHESSSRSLLLVDEFGKGTSSVDGLALLGAALNSVLTKPHPPHTLVSTHYLHLPQYLLPTPTIRLQQLEHILQDGQLVFLYKVMEGSSEISFAHQVALLTGIQACIVKRAESVMKQMENTKLPSIAGVQGKEVDKCIHDTKQLLTCSKVDWTKFLKRGK